MRIYEDLRNVQSRLAVVQSVVVGLFLLLVIQFWNLQVVRGRYFRALAENNRSRAVSLAAPRGTLLDRDGRVLVENRPSFNLLLNTEHAESLDRVVVRLAHALQVGEAQIRERVARRTLFRTPVVKADATLADVAAWEARRYELGEVSLEVVPLRSYPLAAAAAHALGRVGEISEKQLLLPEFEGLEPGALVGQAGLESQYNRQLMGEDGYRRVIVNSRGLEVLEAERRAPLEGPSLTLTLDSRLQEAMDRAFRGRAGSAVALDPETGEILAMTSTPAYDPNQFTTGIDPVVWGRLARDPETPLMNRVIQGTYAPGSTFKIVMATAGLEEGVITPTTTHYCPGYLSIYGTVFRCNRPGGHGVVNVHQALKQSCNVFFYQLGKSLEISRIAAYAKRLGLGGATGVDLPHEVSGLMPSPEWKLRTQKVQWFSGETISVAIGQGQVSATPLQMARVVSAVANGGRLVQPHLVRRIGSEAVASPPPVDLGFKPSTIEVVRAGLQAVVEGGTGWRSRLPGIAVCGKTGTAQLVGKARLEKSPTTLAIKPHGWFVAFAPAENPRIALAVLVEHAGSGGEGAAPVAREILAAFFGLPGSAPAGAGITDTETAMD
jgi:penicillin-binding protein 2